IKLPPSLPPPRPPISTDPPAASIVPSGDMANAVTHPSLSERGFGRSLGPCPWACGGLDRLTPNPSVNRSNQPTCDPTRSRGRVRSSRIIALALSSPQEEGTPGGPRGRTAPAGPRRAAVGAVHDPGPHGLPRSLL